MKPQVLALFATTLLAGCSFTEDKASSDYQLHGQLNNTREFGTVISVDQDAHIGVHNVGTAATAAAGNTAGALVGASSIGNWFTSGSESASVGSETALHYVIRKDDGTIINVEQIPEDGEIVIYPGQRAMIQTNGKFVRLYPGDVEHRRGSSGY